jgi:transposase
VARARELCGGSAESVGGNLGLSLRQANMALAGGDAAQAARIAEAALARPRHSPLQLANLMLQRTAIALATGDWETSGRFARAADRVFPGYWLAEAFVAQQRALEGDTRGAESAYRAIAARTGNPDVYGALAVLAEERGDAAARRAYLAAAGKGWASRVALLPHTYGGHFGEYLALTGDLAGGLRAAGDDYAGRPYLQPMTDYVFVLGKAGDHRRIVAVVDRGEEMGFRSATLMLAKADALAALGRDGESRAARAAAQRLNPQIEHPRQAFVHFRQD